MTYKFKLFNSEKEYEQFCQKAGLSPLRCEHTAVVGDYTFRWFYMQEKDFRYKQYILGAFKHPDGEHISIVDKAHQLYEQRNKEIDAWLRTQEGREAHKESWGCYPEDLVRDCEDYFAAKPRWQCKGKYEEYYKDYHYGKG